MKNLLNVFGTKSSKDEKEELAHINQEMYKKSAELAERNKTLSLLRKIDEIILGSVTNKEEIGQQVTNILVNEGNFEIACLFIYNKQENLVERIGLMIHTPPETKLEDIPAVSSIPLVSTPYILSEVINDRAVKSTTNLSDLLFGPQVTPNYIQSVQQATAVQLSMLYPLVVRNELIGILLVSLPKTENTLSEYQKDLLLRLSEVIGIALYNALLYQKIQEANEKLKALDHLKDEFVSLASHELRTPMTAIKSYLWLFLQYNKTQLGLKESLYIERAYEATDRLINLVNDMLNVSRIESGRMTIAMKPVNMLQLVKEVADELAPTAQKGKVEVSIEPASEQLPNVSADQNKIREVLINLIGNSLKFTDMGGRISIKMSTDKDMFITKVVDTGKGIKAEDMPKLFQKFGIIGSNYLTRQGTTGTQGTGLGLYICKSIIKLHGGEIFAESAGENKGTTFTFSLKINQHGEEMVREIMDEEASKVPPKEEKTS